MRCVIVDTSRSPFAKLRPVPLNSVKLRDEFWAPRIKQLREVTLPSQYDILEDTGRLGNFRVAATGEGEIRWRIADDSDVYKWLEAASLTLGYEPDERLEELVSSVVRDIAAAQDEDGYLFTLYYNRREERWRDLERMHELYCAGHLFQAAVAHRRATGSGELLRVAVRLADHIASVFGPGKREGAPGHPEIEMALVELYRETGRREYVELSRFFIDCRGRGLVGGSECLIDHKPFRELDGITGHAVRALYLNCGATDLYMETGDKSLLETLERLWRSMARRRMYVTGGVGSRHVCESFGDDYELPNVRAYAETCAAVANVMWNWRMLLALGEARFADVMELAMYNGALSGISLDGRRYFYCNPLADRGRSRRQPWFSCACCPTNIVRMLASVPGYMYSTSGDGLWVHLYAESEAAIDVAGREVRVAQRTRYPWDGDVELTLELEGSLEFSLFVRIPGWCDGAEVLVNGREVEAEAAPGSYFELRRVWRSGDRVEIRLPMTVRLVVSHPHVLCNACRAAITRGPMVYCLEHVDNPEFDVWDVALLSDEPLEAEYVPGLLGGVVVVRGWGVVMDGEAWGDSLYLPLSRAPKAARRVRVTAIPYYAWANREPGPMITWVVLARSGLLR